MGYDFPKVDLLIKSKERIVSKKQIEENANIIQKTLYEFNVYGKVINVSTTNLVTRYSIKLKLGVSANKIFKLKDELQYRLAARYINVEAITEKQVVIIDVLNSEIDKLYLGDCLNIEDLNDTNYKIPIIIGKNFNNEIIIEDLAQLPHLIISGSTGTGKSNLLNTFIIDIIYRLRPEEIKLILVDTRLVNFPRFNKIPHLMISVITESRKVLGMLSYLIQEINNRFKIFNEENVDNIDEYNKMATEKLPRIVVIIEDFCDLVMDLGKEIEEYLVKVVQISRAAGIHVIISTQRPSTDVITGTIKSNMPGRIAFKVPSQIDSRTIIDVAGAEDLLMDGNIFFKKIGMSKPMKGQAPFISDEEIDKILDYISINNEHQYNEDVIEIIDGDSNNSNSTYNDENEEDETDSLLFDAIELCIVLGQASASIIQRKFKVGYARASKIIDQMEDIGVISGYKSDKPREVLITLDQWKDIINQ